MSVRAMKAGAVDFLTKPFQDQDVLDAIHEAIERDRERRRDAVLVCDLQSRYASLTERERQTMRLVVSGNANKQIAAALDLSQMTIKVHRGQVMRKMRAGSLPELVRMADRLAGASKSASAEFVPAVDEPVPANGPGDPGSLDSLSRIYRRA
jgi:FixJ family two-component response regulator